MIDYLVSLYESTFLASLNSDAFTIGAFLSVTFTLAMFHSSYLIIFKKESASHFITTSSIAIYFLISSFIMDNAIKVVQMVGGDDQRYIYLIFAVLNIAVGKLLHLIHNRFCGFKSILLHSSTGILNLMAGLHLFIWFKLVIFDLTTEVPLLNMFYSFSIIYLSAALGIALMFPKVLNTKFKMLINPTIHLEK